MAINKVVLTGRLTKEPEIRYTQAGKAVANISLAVGRKFKRDEADFFECIAWNKTAEITAEHLRKGNLIGITGSLRQNRYEKDGQKKSRVEIYIEQLEFLESKNTSNSNGANRTEEDYKDLFPGSEVTVDDDEFPF